MCVYDFLVLIQCIMFLAAVFNDINKLVEYLTILCNNH